MQPSIVRFSFDGASNVLRLWYPLPGGDTFNDFTIDGAASVRQGSADDPECYQGAKTEVYEFVTNLLATWRSMMMVMMLVGVWILFHLQRHMYLSDSILIILHLMF